LPKSRVQVSGDPVGIRLLDWTFRERRDQAVEALREPAHHSVRERHRALEPRLAHELDRVVDDRVLGLVGERELVRAQPQRSLDRPIELAHGTLAELLDAEVERAGALHGPVREALRERAVTRVKPFHGRGECAVGVGLLFEDTPDDVVRGLTRRRDHRRPRRNSS